MYFANKMFYMGGEFLQNATKQRKKLNYIDILVIVLLAALVILLVIRGISALKASKMPVPEQAKQDARTVPDDFQPNFRVTLVCRAVTEDEAARIAATEYRRLYNNYTLLPAYITDIRLAETEEGTDIYFTVEAYTDPTGPMAMIGGNFNPIISDRELRVGKLYTLKTMDIEIDTTVTDMEILYEAD